VKPLTVDSHHHFWDPAEAEYPWMTDELAPIRRRFGPDQLRPHLEKAGVSKTVVVQARSSTEETRTLMKTSADTDFVAGVVGWVDLTDVRLGDVLDDLRREPGGAALVGVRHQVHDEPDPGWLSRPDVRRGLQAVGERGLAYDLLVRVRELPAAWAAARALPEVRFVIDHIGKPPIASGDVNEWATAMAPFGALENVSCKLSGMVTEADWDGWSPSDLEPYVRRVVDWFGEDRLMFGSDWPVCTLAATYEEVLDTLDRCLGDLSSPARAKVFGGNAGEFYGLRSEGRC
jgi:L-fuconolactonase